jgi:hypothetical protein
MTAFVRDNRNPALSNGGTADGRRRSENAERFGPDGGSHVHQPCIAGNEELALSKHGKCLPDAPLSRTFNPRHVSRKPTGFVSGAPLFHYAKADYADLGESISKLTYEASEVFRRPLLIRDHCRALDAQDGALSDTEFSEHRSGPQ